MYKYHDEYKKAAGDPKAQARWAHKLTWQIARHTISEELLIYPLCEEYLGARAEGQNRNDYLCIKQKLSHLQTLTPGTAEYDDTIDKIMSELHMHNDNKETTDLPQLEAVLGANGSKEAGYMFTHTTNFIPNGYAPETLPAKTLADILVLPMEELKNTLAKFLRDERMKSNNGAFFCLRWLYKIRGMSLN
ncbi:hhe domain-containing protein [Moniliophthora roreri MCA 2997]|uniref:Hhe domain-containing protein n=2 Tax=Moniliophthora roreri TaxID=221103 RepID=V2YGP5_MONRO|nr:hhe domain-containing protein [Moniliophthora roreri MCA 2997]KAI3604862.1 hhe domain-containing protein [Moniliophthora roreri]